MHDDGAVGHYSQFHHAISPTNFVMATLTSLGINSVASLLASGYRPWAQITIVLRDCHAFVTEHGNSALRVAQTHEM